MTDPVIDTLYGPQRLSRMIRYYRIMARSPYNGAGSSNRELAHSRIRQLIAEARHAH